jgi:hypothetical protein
MSKYIIYFNQQWVGEHSSEWFQSRGPLARQVVTEMKEAGVLVFAGGLEEEIESAFGFSETGSAGGPITRDGEFIGGMTIIEVASDEEAKVWGAKVAVACGWPQEVRKFKGGFEN